jgi:plasmid stability protein
MARLNLEIPADLKQRAKIKAAHEQRTLTDVVEELLRQWIAGADRGSRRRRLSLGVYKLGVKGTLSRRELYEDLR